MFSAVVSSLLQMATERNLNDQGVARKLLASLVKLNRKIRHWRKQALADQKKLRKLHRASNAANLKSIRALGSLLVEARSAVLGAVKHIDELNNAIFIIQRAIARKAKENHHWKRICEDQKRVARLFTSSIEDLKAMVQKSAETFISFN